VLNNAGLNMFSYIDSVKDLQEFRPAYCDLRLLDIKMLVLNGFELCEKIVEIDRTRHVIFITAPEQFYEKMREKI
jgi:two-component SAPR family response regulator